MLDNVKEFLIGSSPLDLAYFIILFISVIQCYINGFVSSLISASKWILSYVGTLFLFPILRPYMDGLSSNEYALDISCKAAWNILSLGFGFGDLGGNRILRV